MTKWKWLAVTVLIAALLAWLLHTRRFELPVLRLEARRQHLCPPPLAVAGVCPRPRLRHLLRPGPALGGISEAAQAQPSMRNLFPPPYRLHRHHPVRPARRIRPALPDRAQRTGPGHLPDRRLGAGAHFRPADGPAALRLRADSGPVVRPACGPEASLGAGRGRQDRWTARRCAVLLVLLSLRHFAEPAAPPAGRPSRFLPERDSRDSRSYKRPLSREWNPRAAKAPCSWYSATRSWSGC